jgi:Skp family chaperone for outer membrane proteins
MSRLLLALFAAAVLLAHTVAPTMAQTAPNIAIVDMQRIMRDSLAAKSVQAQLEKQRGVYSQELSKQENELRAAEQELNRQRTLVSPEAFAERRRQFEQKQANLQKEVQARRREFEKLQGGALRNIEAALSEIIQQLIVERKLTLVLPKQVVMSHIPEYEVTDEVMKRLNAKLPSVKVAAPSATPGK